LDRLWPAGRGAAVVAIGDVHVDAPAALSIGDGLDAFIRPEHLTVAARGVPGSLPGTIAAQAFQGDHIDLHIAMPGLACERVVARAPGIAALSAYPVGAEIGLIIRPGDIVAFPPEGARDAKDLHRKLL
jgi:hypothetical protein